MKLVCLDSHVLLWGVREIATPGQEDLIPRAKAFLGDAKMNGLRLLVPSIVVAELLSAIEEKHHALTSNLLSSGFMTPAFDLSAASHFARLWQRKQESGLIESIRKEQGATRSELKADCMIVATSLAQKAEAIYSHDFKLKRFANGEIDVLEIPALAPRSQVGLPF